MRLALYLASSLLLVAVIAVCVRPADEQRSSVSLIDAPQHLQPHLSLFSNLGASPAKTSGVNHGEKSATRSGSSSSSFDAAALFSKPNDVHASSMLVKTKPGEKLNLAPVRRAVPPAPKSASLSAPQLLRAASELARSRAASLYPADKAAKPDKFDGVKDWVIETIPQVCCSPLYLNI
jgi:hypothetical protein